MKRKIAKGLIAVSSLAHLIFAGIHVKALLLLENEICGFLMFLFILFGLVTLFEMTRIREGQLSGQALTAAFCFVTIGFGFGLTSIYRQAIAAQKALETAMVTKAAGFSFLLMAAYALAGGLLVLELVKRDGPAAR